MPTRFQDLSAPRAPCRIQPLDRYRSSRPARTLSITRSRRARQTPPRGVVYVEVLICFLPVFMTFLALCQLSLMFAAQTIVQHAATRAARAAMVVLEDDPERYDGAPRGDLTAGSGSSGQGLPAQLSTEQTEPPAAAAPTENSSSSTGAPSAPSGARMAAIRAAAYHPLAVLAPSLSSWWSGTLKGALSDGSFDRILSGRLIYNLGGAAVTVHAPGEDEVLTRVGRRDPITVRVAYVMPCSVPIVSALMCSGRMARWAGALGWGDDATQELLDRMEFVESENVRDLILSALPRLKLLTAEAIMPNQGADYYGSNP